jgi:hypothetical protein
MLDGKAYEALLSDKGQSDLVPRLHDPALLSAFAALEHDPVQKAASGRKHKGRK